MNKTFTRKSTASETKQENIHADVSPSQDMVRLLIHYSKALQVIRCESISTCFLMLN
jgi:hypothetical protein